MAKPPFITHVDTSRRQSIVIFGDTVGFSNFARRTSDQPEIHRAYLLDLYNIAFQYQEETGAFLKLLCDGFMFVHEFDAIPAANEIKNVLERVAHVQREVESAIRKVRYPRPDGFRTRVCMGITWAMRITRGAPEECAQEQCAYRYERDYFEYPTILAERMLHIRKHEVQLMCSQEIKEAVEGVESAFTFRKVPTERRVPDGIFKEDLENLWQFSL